MCVKNGTMHSIQNRRWVIKQNINIMHFHGKSRTKSYYFSNWNRKKELSMKKMDFPEISIAIVALKSLKIAFEDFKAFRAWPEFENFLMPLIELLGFPFIFNALKSGLSLTGTNAVCQRSIKSNSFLRPKPKAKISTTNLKYTFKTHLQTAYHYVGWRLSTVIQNILN